MRVAQTQAGSDWGASFAPRIGTDVQLDFLDGDIDRPVVIGGFYNGDDASTFAAGHAPGANHQARSTAGSSQAAMPGVEADSS